MPILRISILNDVNVNQPVAEQEIPTCLEECSDQEEHGLVRRAQQDDKIALSELYERYFEKIYRYCCFKTGDPYEAEDITQETFIKAIREIKHFEFKKGASFSSWLYRLAHNLAVDNFRKKNRIHNIQIFEEALISDIYSSDNPQNSVEIRNDFEHMIDAVKQLTPKQKEVVALRFTSELTLAEVALLMGKTVGTVKSLQHSAVRALRKKMSVCP